MDDFAKRVPEMLAPMIGRDARDIKANYEPPVQGARAFFRVSIKVGHDSWHDQPRYNVHDLPAELTKTASAFKARMVA